MTQIKFSPMKMVVAAGGPAELIVDTDKLSQGAYEAILAQGCKYYVDAKLSHRKAAAAGTPELEPDAEGYKAPKPFGLPEMQDAIDSAMADFCAAEWRERAERAPRLSLDDQCWHELLEPKFRAAGVLAKASAKAGREAVTVASLLAQHGGPEGAYRAVSDKYIRGLYTSAGKEPNEDSVASRINDGWAKLVADHTKLLRAKQKAAARQIDPEAASL